MSLEDRVRAELLAIRKSADGLTVTALTQSPVICGLLGDGDPQVAYNSLVHAILSTDADTSLEAVSSSLGLTSNKPTHLSRLDDFGAEHGYEQRQVRRYSDRGIQQLARLITSSWSVESVPCLDVAAYQISEHRFAFVVETRCQYYIEMQPFQIVLYQGEDEPIDLDVNTTELEDGIWNVTRLTNPIEVEASLETSLVWIWRGELWPKFSVQLCTDCYGKGLTTESLGNKLMVRVLPSTPSVGIEVGHAPRPSY